MALKGTTGLRDLFRLYKIFIVLIASIASESQLRLCNNSFFFYYKKMFSKLLILDPVGNVRVTLKCKISMRSYFRLELTRYKVQY